jgi:hypothetical protein
MQNKPNLLNAQMNVTSLITVDYENIANWKLGENKPNSKPIKPNTNPKQTQYKANQSQYKAKTNPIYWMAFSAVNSFYRGFGEQYYLFADASADVGQRESYWDRFSELKICAYTFRKIVA